MDNRIGLDEFCKDLSAKDKRVELIAAFHFYMKNEQKTMKGTKDFFSTEFENFTKMPA